MSKPSDPPPLVPLFERLLDDLALRPWHPSRALNDLPPSNLHGHYDQVAALYAAANFNDDDSWFQRLKASWLASISEERQHHCEELLVALFDCLRGLLTENDHVFSMPPFIDAASATSQQFTDWQIRLNAVQHYLLNRETILAYFFDRGGWLLENILGDLPATASEDASVVTIPLHDLIKDVPLIVHRIVCTLIDDLNDPGEPTREAFGQTRRQIEQNLLTASNLTYEQAEKAPHRLIFPNAARAIPPADLISAYLGGTPFAELLRTPVPFSFQQARFEHHWIVAGSGHGKTQTLQYLIARDLERVARGDASIIVIDSQGDLIRRISHLDCFAAGGALDGRLCLIDPNDIEYPVALNLFDVNLARINAYSALDRERLINGVIELYDFVMASLLSAELTQKQGVVFRYILRLLLHIPDANIQTLRQMMEPGAYERFKPHIQKLTGTARSFFDNEFTSRQFEDTKRQVIRRLYGILENQTFERMFSHPRNKLDLFVEMNAGRVILINTAKDLLKQQGCEIFGRFFIALIAQAAQERAVLPEHERLPCFIYIDEAQDYLDQNVTLILEQARKYKIGLILAHQYLGQLDNRLIQSLAANSSIKFAGGVSAQDARTLSQMLRCEPGFIEAQGKGSFAAFIRNHTERATALRFPFGVMEDMASMNDADFERLRDAMRARYAVPCADVAAAIAGAAEAAPDEPQSDPAAPSANY